MKYIENETVELKESITDKIIKEVIAFANTKGGIIYIGIKDSGTICGIEESTRELEKLSSMITDTISPDVTFIVSSDIIKIDGKDIIEVKVVKGPSAPYYITSKGMNEKGVFVRFGNTSRPATTAAIKNMIMQSGNITFESSVSNIQDLHFSSLEDNLNNINIKLSKNLEKTFGILNNNDLYTNLAMIMSDECPFSVKIAVYKDDNFESFIDRKEFTGSILKQIDNVIEYLNMFNKMKGEIKIINREDFPDYPEKAIRESVLNAILHRDYSINASILIHIFPSGIKILSLGSLYGDITVKDIMSGGISVTRNMKLQSLLLRLNKVESLGTGIPRIMENYSSNSIKPQITVSDNVFTIFLPKLVIQDNYQEIIINYLNTNENITREKAEQLIGIGKTRTVAILNDMVNNNIINIKGKGRAIKYFKNKEDKYGIYHNISNR